MFSLPHSMVKMVDAKSRKFLWDTRKSRKMLALVNWKSVNLPATNGGWDLNNTGSLGNELLGN